MILGIDLGTTNSLASIWRDGKVELIPNNFGDFLTPSAVGLSDEGDIIVGKLAKERLMSHPQLTKSQFKRYMGTKKKLALGRKHYSAEELSSFILRKLVEDAEVYLGQRIDEIIVSVPAYFDDRQRSATKAAGQLAGVKIERIINEPSAAALALHHFREEDASYLVIDFGGGTLDVSVVDAFMNVIEIVTVAGDNHLGGEDFTQVIVDDFLKVWTDAGISFGDEDLANLYQEAEKAKRVLDKENTAKIHLVANKELYTYTITKDRYLALIHPLLQRIEMPIKRALRDARMTLEDIDDIILVGGNTKMPLVQSYLAYILKRPIKVAINQDQAIALGCGIMAGIKERNEEVKDMVLTDICPFTLGIGIVGDVLSPIIERNTVLPSSRVETYYTTEYGQDRLLFKIYQGEQLTASANTLLGSMEITIPPNMTDYESADVRFSYDINGILEVDICVNSTKQEFHKLILRDSTHLSEAEIKEKRDELAKLKIHPRDSEQSQLLLSKARRLFEDCLGQDREILTQWVRQYETVLDRQDTREIKTATRMFKDQLNTFEEGLWGGGF